MFEWGVVNANSTTLASHIKQYGLRFVSSHLTPASDTDITIREYENGVVSNVSKVRVSVDRHGQITSLVEIQKKKPKPKPPSKPKTPTKPGGGMVKEDFINEHAYDRHKFDSSRVSTKSRMQYGKNVDVKKVRTETLDYPDSTWALYDPKGGSRTFYAKEFADNVSTSDTLTTHHRVIINHNDSSKSTQFPLHPDNL